MKLAVKIFLFLNMSVAVAVVIMAYLIFRDREIIKARTGMLERNAALVARNLNWGVAVDWEAASERKTTPYAVPATVKAGDVPALEANLKELSDLAQTRVEQLTKRWAELLQTREVLARTEEELRLRERELAEARQRIATLERELAGVQSELREANRTASNLSDEKAALEGNLARLTEQLQSLQAQSQALAETISKREGEFKRASDLLSACLNPKRPTGTGENPWKDVPATVLAVDLDWNIAIIDKGEVDTLPMFMEAYVHRGETFIGKIRVMRVENAVAIAEILTDTFIPGATLQPGDTVFF